MGQPLFQLDSSFVSSVSFGNSDAEVNQRLVDAFEDGRLAMRDEIRRRAREADVWKDYADEIDVALQKDGYVVVLPDDAEEELLDLEYGTFTESMKPVLRNGVVQSRQAVEKAIAVMLDFD